ncbi:class I SAM-dependent methyltransferase [Candidatus Thiodictyon syntrophicum]|jgi:2-polyprenyl-3-methyl-5-hydroxy-6-metoxy-1,4-benzoquinol methylase|uniref:Methyltransferase type 11 n=1 Tax=Candidatus Thiodictyon syntrophicum TaxID=1166950 RepID=A0A2K8U6S8_9GAMM|nr:class I SAM-dependent methyltransferase [Candidatus Thiodictyon syntrophicum]AUB80751.1 methyltransferase type 11 [Candidatus Thiodictyon syntrophicum]
MADQGAEGLLSPFLRNRRIAAARPYLEGRVLDFGCGAGALAAWIAPSRYVGIDIDAESLQRARAEFPQHRFLAALPEPAERFDSVITLAVIEHVRDPVALLRLLSGHLTETQTARLVLTTPHPSVDWVHHVGATVGLFSRHASEEHEGLLDRAALTQAGVKAGLTLVCYRRFLFGANQLAVFQRLRQVD